MHAPTLLAHKHGQLLAHSTGAKGVHGVAVHSACPPTQNCYHTCFACHVGHISCSDAVASELPRQPSTRNQSARLLAAGQLAEPLAWPVTTLASLLQCINIFTQSIKLAYQLSCCYTSLDRAGLQTGCKHQATTVPCTAQEWLHVKTPAATSCAHKDAVPTVHVPGATRRNHVLWLS